MDKFQMDEKVLEMNLFSPEDAKLGPCTSLNVNYLPYLASFVMRKISHKERCSLIEFELQTSILELALLQHKFKSIKDISNYMIREMRMNTKFWIHSSESWNEVQLRLKLYHILQPNCKEEVQKKCGGKKSLQEILLDENSLRKYIAQLDFSKLDYKSDFMKISEVFNLIVEYDQANSQNKQLQAIEGYVGTYNTLQYIKSKKYLIKQTKNMEQVQTKYVDLYSRITQPIAKETRQTKNDSVSYRDMRVLLKEQQRLDVEEKRTIFVPNQVLKYQKLDMLILPFIYQFIFRKVSNFTGDHLKVQNLILFLSLSDSETYKNNKIKKNILIEGKGSQKLFMKYLETSKDKLMNDFDQFCTEKEISLANFFSSTPSNYRKELLLMRNIIILGLKYSSQLFTLEYNFNFDTIVNELEELEEEQQKTVNSYQKWNKLDLQNDYYYFQVLSQLELYYNIPLDQYDNLIKVYKSYIEVVYTSKKEHFKEYFGVLRNAKQQDMLGLRSLTEQVELASQNYLLYINAPKTQQKRSYIYHSDQRAEWTETQYKQFLEGLLKHFEIVVNNKRIAKHMGGMNPNHVRFVKGFYLRSLKRRAKERNLNRKDILKEDLEKFDISIFDKVIKK